VLFMLSVVYTECRKQTHYAERRYAESHYADCHYSQCHDALNEAPYSFFNYSHRPYPNKLFYVAFTTNVTLNFNRKELGLMLQN